MIQKREHPLLLIFSLVVAMLVAMLVAIFLVPSEALNVQATGQFIEKATGQAHQQAQPQLTPPPDLLSCTEGVQESNALYQICKPLVWNGTLIVWSHGYVAPSEPLEIRNTLGDVSLPDTYADFGYAFATTSFSKNGMAIREGVDDLLDLVSIFNTQYSTPTRTIVQGVSLGSTSAILAMEENPAVFNGGMAMCGPNGDFQAQIDYFTDGRVLFDHFFPEILAPSPVEIPQALIDDWETVAATTVVPTLANPANSAQVTQLLNTASIAVDSAVPTTTIESITSVLWFNVQGTNDGDETVVRASLWQRRTRLCRLFG